MYNRLYKYLSNNDLLYDKQFGFKKGHSTDHAVLQLASEISDFFDNNLFTLGVFIDLSKAFDTVDHEILISKLNNYGIRGTNLKWFKDYLTNRKQCINCDNKMTTTQSIKCGVPQGSILGPLLFIPYVNDLHRHPIYWTLFYLQTILTFFIQTRTSILFLKLSTRNVPILTSGLKLTSSH